MVNLSTGSGAIGQGVCPIFYFFFAILTAGVNGARASSGVKGLVVDVSRLDPSLANQNMLHGLILYVVAYLCIHSLMYCIVINSNSKFVISYSLVNSLQQQNNEM